MTSVTFEPGERARIDAAVEAAQGALSGFDLWPETGGSLYLHHRRAAVRATRGRLRRKPSHAEVAEQTLAWARSQGDVTLYATVAMASAVRTRFGDDGLATAASVHPPLKVASMVADDLVAHLRRTLSRTITRSSEEANPGV